MDGYAGNTESSTRERRGPSGKGWRSSISRSD